MTRRGQGRRPGALHRQHLLRRLADVDLVIEAVFEDLDSQEGRVRRNSTASASRAPCSPPTPRTSTSTPSPPAPARPQDVIGLHFFSPGQHHEAAGDRGARQGVSADVVATAFELAKKLKKVPVRAGVCDGFIGNRILAVYAQAADYLMEDGASPLRDRRGRARLRLSDGPVPGDRPGRRRHRLGHAQAPRRHARPARRATCRWPTASASAAGSARRPQRGFYLYPQGARVGQPDPEVLAIVDAERAARRHHAAHVHRRRDHAPLHGRDGQRRRQRGARRHRAAPARRGRDLPLRLRLSALSAAAR